MPARPPAVPVGSIHPVHALLLAGAFALFLCALLADIAYSQSYQIQWKNFASWLLVGALIFSGLATLWALVSRFRRRVGTGRLTLYLVVLGLAFLLGLWNAFVHAEDAWSSMPLALILSVIVALLISVATWIGFSSLRAGAVR